MESNALTRLKRVAGKQTTTLTHYGRKTGKPHEVTIWFVQDGDKLSIGTANVNRQWVRNVQKTPQIRLSMGGETFNGTARFLTDRAEHERAMAAIRGKYWMYRPLTAIGRVLTSLGAPLPFVVADRLQINPASFANHPIVGLLMRLTVSRVAATSGATTAAECGQ